MTASPLRRAERVRVFRERLVELIDRSRLSRSAFARSIAIDRSTLSQLVDDETDRLPRAETVAAIATEHNVSTDWLLGLTDLGSAGPDIVQQALEIAPGAPDPADERLARWHAEAAGYKIRYVPSNLPDLVKTERVIRYEYGAGAALPPERGIEVALDRLAYLRRPETDMDVCCPRQTIEGFAGGDGIWSGLDAATRREQLARMRTLADELYPSLRWHLFDGRARYSVPLTIFGPKRAAIYMGQMYFVLNGTEHIRALTRHFDDLVRAAVVTPPEIPEYLSGLLDDARPR